MAIALSWSRLSDYQQCHRKFYLKYISKVFPVEDASKSIHLVKGAEMHGQLEQYAYSKINGQPAPEHFHQSVKEALPIVDKIFANFGQVWPERQVAVDSNWAPEEWFGKAVTWRAIWDISGVNPDKALIFDWKTGKVTDYDEGEPGQLHLSALMAHHIYNVKEVHIAYSFIEHKKFVPEKPMVITEDDFPKLRDYFNRQYNLVNREKEWKPQVNKYCNWCPATKDQCEFSRKANAMEMVK